MDQEFSDVRDYTKSGKFSRISRVEKQQIYTPLETSKNNLNRELQKIMRNAEIYDIREYVELMVKKYQFPTTNAAVLALVIANIHNTEVPAGEDDYFYLDHLGAEGIKRIVEPLVPSKEELSKEEYEKILLSFAWTFIRYTVFVLSD